METNKGAHFIENQNGDRNYTADLPDVCLAGIFQFLSSIDRNHCSLVCQRWLRVDGQSRHRLSLNAKAKMLDFVPSHFSRFDSVTKLALLCDHLSISINDDSLILISLRRKNLTHLKLRGCREITEVEMAVLAKNCKALKKFSCDSCMFGVKGVNAVLDHCTGLEELFVKRLRGVHDSTEVVGLRAAPSSLKSICLKELVNGQSFAPLIISSKKLQTLKLICCLDDWDDTLETIGNLKTVLIEVHLEKIQFSDVDLRGISNCFSLETLHIVKTPDCSNVGLSYVAERCKLLRKLHINERWTNWIGDDGLIATAKHCSNLQEFKLVGAYVTSFSLSALASNCKSLEKLVLCRIRTIGETEIVCIATRCVALKRLCITRCPISNAGIEAVASSCPNLVEIKVRKCKNVTGEVVDLLCEQRGSLAFDFFGRRRKLLYIKINCTRYTLE